MRRIPLLVTLLLSLSGIASAACPAPFGGDGRAFYYFASPRIGACALEWGPEERIVAISGAQWDGASHCGEFLRVTGPLGSIVVRVVDRCPECAANDLDLSPNAFADIAEPVSGQAAIRWERIAHPNPGPLAFRFREGSSEFFLSLQVREHRYGITAMSVFADGAYRPMQRRDDSYFDYAQTRGPGPVQIRVTASTGEVLEQTLPLLNGDIAVGQGQFAPCSDAQFRDGFETPVALRAAQANVAL